MVRAETALAVTKWMGLSAAIWVQASAGNAYMFAFYSPSLKAVLHYNQLQLNNLGVAKDIGENVGLLAGLLCNKVPAWTLLCIGAVCGFLGYGTLWLVVSGQIAPLPYWQMCIIQMVGSNSATWFNTAVLVTCMRNFPHSRGTVVGILKGFVGLSAAIFTQIYTALLTDNANLLLLFLTLGPTAVCLASMLLVRPVPVAAIPFREPEEGRNFHYITSVCIALAAYLFAINLGEELVPMNQVVPVVLTAVMIIFLVAPLAIPVKVISKECCGINPSAGDHDDEEVARGVHEPLLKDASTDHTDTTAPLPIRDVEASPGAHESDIEEEAESSNVTPDPYSSDQDDRGHRGKRVTLHEEVVARLDRQEEDAGTLLVVGEGAMKRPRRRPRRGEDFNLRQALVKADFWILFLTFFCGVGTGVTAINNLGQIGEAQGYHNVNIFVSLISIANFLGRLGGGAVSEHYVRTDAVPRTVWLALAQILLIFVHLMFASALPGTLYLGSILLGLCYGVHFSIMVPTASELFGLKHFGMIYNFLTIANPLGSFLFSGLIAGYLYDREAAKDSVLLSKEVCNGAHCFRLTFYVMAAVAAVGVVLTTVLTLRIRSVYVALYRKSPHPSAQDVKAVE